MSSLSSGFGDGEMLFPASAKARASTGSGTSAGSRSHRRDTVYTEASEDTPTRFRTVNSWVRVQTSRIKRAKWQEEDTPTGQAPPVPNLPPEQDFGLMMPDGEEPRRVSDTAIKIEYGTAH